MNERQKRFVICSLIILNCLDCYKHKIVLLVIRYICSSESKVDSCFCAKNLRIYLIRLLLVVKLRVKQAWPLSHINSEPPTMDCCCCSVCNREISFLTYFSVVCIGMKPSGALDHFCHSYATKLPWHHLKQPRKDLFSLEGSANDLQLLNSSVVSFLSAASTDHVLHLLSVPTNSCLSLYSLGCFTWWNSLAHQIRNIRVWYS